MYISILITTYNAKRYVIDTLNSLINQTYKYYEIVIVDDGSTDTTLDIIKDYAFKHPSIKIHIHSLPHYGRAAALNLAIQLAQYDWLAIIDADDLWNAHKLELQTAYIKKFNIHFLAANSLVFSDNPPQDFTLSLDLHPTATKLKKITFDAMLCSNKISHCSILAKKELINYNIKRNTQIDYEMYLRFLWQGGQIYLLNETLVYHRLHDHQAFESKRRFFYVANSIFLQLKYCWRGRKIFPIIIVFLSIFYHLFSIKKVRILRNRLLRKNIGLTR